MVLLTKIIDYWHSLSAHHHYLILGGKIILIIAIAAGLHHFLNKLVNNFIIIYSKYNKQLTKDFRDLLEILAKACHKPLIVLIWVICAILIIECLNKQPIDLLKFLASIAIITWLLLRLLQQTEEYLINFVYNGEHKNLRQNKTTIIAIGRLLKIVLVFFAFLIVMQRLYVDITGILAIGGAGTIVLGIAAKELLANFFGGMMIFMDRQFMVGDSIKSPNQDIEGTVEYIGWRLTKVRTVDHSVLYVPNSVFLTISVENSSKRYNRQIKEIIRIKYHDLKKIKLLIAELSEMLKNHPDLDNTKMQFVGITQFDFMAVNCLLWCFTKATDTESSLRVQHDVMYKVVEVLAKHDIEIAFNKDYK